jgi:hypothetical protein
LKVFAVPIFGQGGRILAKLLAVSLVKPRSAGPPEEEKTVRYLDKPICIGEIADEMSTM